MNIKLSYRWASVVMLLALMVTSALVIFFAKDIRMIGTLNYFAGPRFYPIALASLIIIFSVLSIVEVWRKPDQHIIIKNVQRPVILLGIIIAWAYLWEATGRFYVVSSGSIAVIMYCLSPASRSIKKVLVTLAMAVIIMAVIYLIFSVGLRVRI